MFQGIAAVARSKRGRTDPLRAVHGPGLRLADDACSAPLPGFSLIVRGRGRDDRRRLRDHGRDRRTGVRRRGQGRPSHRQDSDGRRVVRDGRPAVRSDDTDRRHRIGVRHPGDGRLPRRGAGHDGLHAGRGIRRREPGDGVRRGPEARALWPGAPRLWPEGPSRGSGAFGRCSWCWPPHICWLGPRRSSCWPGPAARGRRHPRASRPRASLRKRGAWFLPPPERRARESTRGWEGLRPLPP